MIYVIAVVFGMAACVQSFLSEVTAGNLTHLKNGRSPNAGAAIFPTIPLVPLLFIGAAWLLRTFVTEYATVILVGAFFAHSFFWVFSFARLRAELRRLEMTRNDVQTPPPRGAGRRQLNL